MKAYISTAGLSTIFLSLTFIMILFHNYSMNNILLIVIPVIAVLIVIIILFLIMTRNSKNKGGDKKKNSVKGKDSASRLKEANRRLAQNPKDVDALQAVADIHFQEGSFDKSLRSYEALVNLCATNKELNEFDMNLKYALSALRLDYFDEAYKSLMFARSLNQEVFDVNYNLGFLEFKRKNYEKAAVLLLRARKEQPEHVQTIKYLGQSLFKLKRYRESAALLRKTIDLQPDDKESLFALAQVYHNLSQNEQAIKIFTHLRPDPVMGPSAALYAGTIHVKSRQLAKAAMDFEIGLRHKDIKPEIMLELKYRLATTYVKQQELGSAVKLFKEIGQIQQNYKDVQEQLQQYSEMHTNRNLQIYLISPTSDFITLCRKMVTAFFPKAKVKITDISVHKNEYADILTEISTKKWDDIILFRFMRTNGIVGELILRDLYSRLKELRAGRGFCLSAGEYSDSAVQFVEARLIDLIEKKQLIEKLNTLNDKLI